MSEVQPGLFYALSVQSGSVIFSVTSAGVFKTIYSFPVANNNHVYTLVQGTNTRLYGAGGGTAGYYYYSMTLWAAASSNTRFPTSQTRGDH